MRIGAGDKLGRRVGILIAEGFIVEGYGMHDSAFTFLTISFLYRVALPRNSEKNDVALCPSPIQTLNSSDEMHHTYPIKSLPTHTLYSFDL
jgi:hypothetical protein